jgi:altronate dehydratase large subunit
MVAGGAQVVVFSTGRGSPAGFPTAPVIKVTGNPETYARMRENIDLDASPALDGTMHPREMGDHIFRLILEVSSGQQTAAETLGHHELLAIWRAP